MNAGRGAQSADAIGRRSTPRLRLDVQGDGGARYERVPLVGDADAAQGREGTEGVRAQTRSAYRDCIGAGDGGADSKDAAGANNAYARKYRPIAGQGSRINTVIIQ